MPTIHHTIAASRNIPLGTHIHIAGLSDDFIVEDRTAKRFDGRIDIFMSNKQTTLKWANRKKG